MPNIGDLRRLAANVGGTAHVGGQVINAQGARMRLHSRPKDAPAPEPAPAPAPAPALDLTSLVDAVLRMGDKIAEAVGPREPGPMPTAQPLPAPPPRPRELPTLTAIRGADHYIESVRIAAGSRLVMLSAKRDDTGRLIELRTEGDRPLRFAITRDARGDLTSVAATRG